MVGGTTDSDFSELLLHAILESTADGILVVDNEGRTAYANERFVEMWRIPAELMATRSDERLLSFVLDQLLDPAAFLAKVHELYGTTRDDFDTLRFKDGREFERYSRPLLRQRAPAGRVWSFRDVTQYRRAEGQLHEAEARYRALVEQIPAIVYTDMPGPDLVTVYVSPQIESVLGVSQKAYLNDPSLWERHLHPDDRERVLAEYARFLESGENRGIEYRFIRGDRTEVWVHDRAVILRDASGEPVLIQGVMFDITDRKLAEDAIRQALQLEREAASQLRAVDEMKNTFLSAVSHELRTPLTTILGSALTLERDDADLNSADARDLVHRLAANARKLDRLLSELLDVDRLSRGIVAPNRRPTDVAALVRGFVEGSDHLAGRRVLLELRPVVVSVDPAKVERIVENLIANSVRHTDPEVPIWVRVWDQDGGALIAVEDSGPGIPAELREAIFEPFRQIAPSRPSASPGVGIGLALVAGFAELHGGRAWVEEREGGGSSFRVYLPDGEPAAPAD